MTGVHKSSVWACYFAPLLACSLWLRCLARRAGALFVQPDLRVHRARGCPGSARHSMFFLRVKDGLHHFDVFISCRDHEAGITNNVTPVAPISCEQGPHVAACASSAFVMHASCAGRLQQSLFIDNTGHLPGAGCASRPGMAAGTICIRHSRRAHRLRSHL